MDFAEKLELARIGRLSESDAAALTTAQNMEAMRSLVSASDFAWISSGLVSSSPQLSAFHIGLTKNFSIVPEAKHAFRSAWPSATPLQQMHLLWRILDDPELPLEWHERLFSVVTQNWADFQKACIAFYGGNADALVAGEVERYLSPSLYPATKKWAFLCSLASVEGYPFARRFFLEMGSRSDLPFERRVATALLADARP